MTSRHKKCSAFSKEKESVLLLRGFSTAHCLVLLRLIVTFQDKKLMSNFKVLNDQQDTSTAVKQSLVYHLVYNTINSFYKISNGILNKASN